MAGARISGWRGAARRRRMVAARLLEVDGRIDGAGGFWIEQLPPARSKRFVERGKPSDLAAFSAYIDKLRPQIAAKGGDGLAFLVDETHSPTRERLRAELEKIFPKMRWCVYEPLLSDAENYATQV